MTQKTNHHDVPPKPRGVVRPVTGLMSLSLGQLMGTRWVWLFVIMLLVPVGFAVFWAVQDQIRNDLLVLFNEMFVAAYLRFLVPFSALLFGATLISSEREGRTLTYLVTRPVPRWLIILTKYAAAATVCVAGVLLSMAATYSALGIYFGSGPLMKYLFIWERLAAIAAAGVLVYLAIFLFIGSITRWPVLVGLIFLLVWETFVALIPAMIRFMTVSHYLNSLVVAATREHTVVAPLSTVIEAPPNACYLVLGTIFVSFLGFSVWRFVSAEFHSNPDRK